MKICVFSRSTPMHSMSGGMEKHCFSICNGFAKMGCQVTLITTSHPFKNIECIKVSDNFRVFFLKNTKSGKYSYNYWSKSLKIFLELNKDYNFDIVFSESIGALSVIKYRKKRNFKIPIIFNVVGTALRDAYSQLRQLTLRSLAAFIKNLFCHFRDKKWFKYVDGFIVCSNEIKESMIRYLGIPENKIFVVYNGIDIDKFYIYSAEQKRNIRTKYKISDDEAVILAVSRLKREKGLHLLIYAISDIIEKFSNIKLLIVGDGPYKKNLVKLVTKLDLERFVRFLNLVPNENLPEIYNMSDVFVFPSVAKEGFPFVIIEAMACGVPVIASKVGGVVEVIKDEENGLLFSSGDVVGLKENIIRVLSDKQLREKLVFNAFPLVKEKFTEEVMIKKTIEVLKRYVKVS